MRRLIPGRNALRAGIALGGLSTFVPLAVLHLVSQHFGDVRDASDSLRTSLPDAPRTHPKNNNIGTRTLHSVLRELEV